MSFLSVDTSRVAHLLDTETTNGTTEMFSHGIKAVKRGGAKPYKNLDLGVTGVNVDVAALQLYGGTVHNQHASSRRYLKLYNIASPPTSSDIPVQTIPLEPSKQTDLAQYLVGLEFTLGLGLRATTGIADTDTGAPSTNDVVVNLGTSSLGGFATSVVATCPMDAPAPVVTGS